MRFHYALGLALGLVAVTIVNAQTGSPNPKAAPTPAQPGQPQAPQPGQVPQGQAVPVQVNLYPVPIYRMNDASKALNLNQEQINRLNKITEQTQTQYREQYSKLSTLNEAERLARAQELNRLYYSDWNKSARDIFDDQQRTRHQQLYYQYGGFNTLYEPEIQKQINLTPEQVKNLRESAEWSNQQWQEIHRMGTTDPTKATQMYRDYWTQRQERFNKFLTPDQQKAWRDLTGEPYTFQPTFGPSR